jgi:hypothetical protein
MKVYKPELVQHIWHKIVVGQQLSLSEKVFKNRHKDLFPIMKQKKTKIFCSMKSPIHW